ncbi:hypothetical protein D3C72_1399560 [compost metagenome]
MGHDTGQVDGRFDAGVAATNHRHALALEQRTVAVRAVRHAFVAVFLLARHVHFTPARTGRENHALGFEGRAAGETDFVQLAVFARDQLVGALQVHDVDVVLLDVFFQRRGQLRPFGFLYGNEVLDGHGVEHLPAETLSGDASADTFTCSVNRCRRTGRATTDDQHIKGLFGADFLSLALDGTGVEFGEDFF